MQLKRPPFVSLCWFLRMMKRSLEVNFRGASMAQSVKENKNEPDSAAWYWKLMYGRFMSSTHEFTTMSAWLYYHLEGKLSQQTNTGRAITTEDHLHRGCDGRERTTFQFSNLTGVGTAITHLKTNLSFRLLAYSSGLLLSVLKVGCFFASVKATEMIQLFIYNKSLPEVKTLLVLI